MGFVSDNLIIILGLLIPFAGIIFPLLVLLVFQVRHPESTAPKEPSVIVVGPGATPIGAPTMPRSRGRSDGTRDAPPTVIDSSELIWFRDRLRESDAFGGLTDSELRYVAGLGQRRRVYAGERLAEGGSRGETLFVILKGELRLLTHTTPEVHVRTAHAGETVPLAVIIDPPVLVTTVEAATDGEVFAIPRKRLLDLLEKHPLIGYQVYRAAAKVFEHRYRTTLDHEVIADKPE